jgi:hypothetical protein
MRQIEDSKNLTDKLHEAFRCLEFTEPASKFLKHSISSVLRTSNNVITIKQMLQRCTVLLVHVRQFQSVNFFSKFLPQSPSEM